MKKNLKLTETKQQQPIAKNKKYLGKESNIHQQ